MCYILFWSGLLTWTGLYTGEFQACQLSLFCLESHDFSASLIVSWPHKVISRAVHFAMWISPDAGLMVQLTPISYLQGRMQCDVGNGHLILLTTEEGGIFMRLNCIHTNCVHKGWWHQASIEVVFDSETAHLPTVGVANKQFHWGHTHL